MFIHLFLVRLRKMEADEHPLVLSLLWGKFRNKKSFFLQENENVNLMVCPCSMYTDSLQCHVLRQNVLYLCLHSIYAQSLGTRALLLIR